MKGRMRPYLPELTIRDYNTYQWYQRGVRRQLYTDSGLSVFAFRRVLLLNGIDLGGLRGDLSERLLTIHLEPISDQNRRTEHALTHA